MKAAFADTWFWIALTNRDDNRHKQAKAIKAKLGDCYVVTTDEVFVELLAHYSKAPHTRELAVHFVKGLLESDVEVLSQSRDSFLSGLKLYENRPDKQYSLVDCISMQTMKAMQITDVLTHDKHFVQEGFKALLRVE